MLVTASKIVGGVGWSSLIFAVGNEPVNLYNIALLTVLIGGVLAYVVAQVRDYKPNRRLREDNADLRHDIDDLQKRYDDVVTENQRLRHSRDFEQALAAAIQAIGDSRVEILSAIQNQADALHEVANAIREGGKSDESRTTH